MEDLDWIYLTGGGGGWGGYQGWDNVNMAVQCQSLPVTWASLLWLFVKPLLEFPRRQEMNCSCGRKSKAS